MNKSGSFLEKFSQNKVVPIRIVSPDFGHLSPQNNTEHNLSRRLPYYYFLLVIDGTTRHSIDLDIIDIGKDELLFGLPHQVQQLPDGLHGKDYFKLGFDEECLSRLPKHYPFLLNPLNRQKIKFSSAGATRLKAIFEILLDLLSTLETDPDLILAHLNSLMAEINAAYFAGNKNVAGDRLNKFLDFKVFVENNLTDHPAIKDIAGELAISTDSLYEIVKQFAGVSPKEFMTNRLILEARRRLYYGEKSSVKELAFDLGFNDADYFSRLFKKTTGKTVARFFRDLS